MKRIIRLNESELARIVRRVVNEYSLPNMGLPSSKSSGGGGGLAGDMARDINNALNPSSDTWSKPSGDTWSKTKPSKHMVSKGDTLSGIASKYGLTLDQLIKLNPGLDDPNKIFTGQMIKLK